jgi:Golgi phosphoprotein 3|eukprot:COSAG02_NODE_7014_length_3227_cov_2.049552_3_plen_168_part_00
MMEEVLLLGLKDEGYTSFWNDSISYGLRGCILAELMLRGRVKCVKAKLPLDEKKLEVVDTSKTGDRILDEVLEVMATSASRAHSCGYWVDVLSGESWNVMKLKFSIKNLRERLAKGLVDKGVLGTESQSFGLFEMATHPLKDASVKEEVVFRVQVSRRQQHRQSAPA